MPSRKKDRPLPPYYYDSTYDVGRPRPMNERYREEITALFHTGGEDRVQNVDRQVVSPYVRHEHRRLMTNAPRPQAF